MGGSKSVDADVVGVDDDGDVNSMSKKDKKNCVNLQRLYILARSGWRRAEHLRLARSSSSLAKC